MIRQTDKLDERSFETLLEVLPTLPHLEHLNLTCSGAQRRVHCPVRPGLNAEMLQRVIGAVQAGPARLRHLKLDGNPLLHGHRGEVVVGARVSVVRKFGHDSNAIAETEGIVVEVELEGPHRRIMIRYAAKMSACEANTLSLPDVLRTDDNDKEYRHFQVVRQAAEFAAADDGMLVLPYNSVDTRGLEAVRQYAASENSPLKRVWMRGLSSDELPPPRQDIAAIVITAAESCPGCAFYVSVGEEHERIIGQLPNVGNTANNVAVGDRIIIGHYPLDDDQVSCLLWARDARECAFVHSFRFSCERSGRSGSSRVCCLSCQNHSAACPSL